MEMHRVCVITHYRAAMKTYLLLVAIAKGKAGHMYPRGDKLSQPHHMTCDLL